MYKFVGEAECKRYRSDCSSVLKKVCSMLKKEGISAQFTLVGSGARNMVTRNGDGPFDLDYNLEIITAPEAYWKDLRRLKDTVRVLLDKAAKSECFSPSQDSTSCLTALLHFEDEPGVAFRFDVAIVRRNPAGALCKLVHNKLSLRPEQDQYVWNEVPNSHNVAQKAARLKAEGLWHEVRNRYVERKDHYATGLWGKDHPSFIVYIEAVNEIYSKHFR